MSGLACFDFANYLTDIKAIIKDLFQYNATGVSITAFGYYRQPANKIRGFYWDFFSGGVFHFIQHSPSITPNGNVAGWEANKRAVAIYARDQMRVLDSAFYMTSEAPEEGLIGAFDALHLGTVGTVRNDYGQFFPGFQICYGRYQGLLDLSVNFNDGAVNGTSVPTDQSDFYVRLLNASFHATGGRLCLNNHTQYMVVPIDPPTFFNCPAYIILIAVKSFIDKMTATPMIRKYMRRGFRQRPLPASWEGDYIESGQSLYDFVGFRSGSAGTYYTSSVWMLPDADADFASTSHNIGIVISGVLTATNTYNIYMDARAYNLSPTSIKVLYSRLGAVRTEVARFTDVLDIDITVTFDGVSAPLLLYEVVQL